MAVYAEMEDVLNSVKDYLEGNLDAELTAIEAARSCVIPRWQTLQVGESGSGQYPAIDILPVEDEPDYQRGRNPLLNGHEYHRVLIEVMISGSDHNEVTLSCLRYREALKALVVSDSTFGGSLVDVQIEQADYSPLFKEEQTSKLLQILDQPLLIKEPF